VVDIHHHVLKSTTSYSGGGATRETSWKGATLCS